MKFISHAQEKAYAKAMNRNYKAVAFDVDGTLTPFARFIIPESLKKTISQIPKEVQLIICTGRPIQYILGKIEHIIQASEDPEAERKRWHVISNNGCTVSVYNAKKDEYQMIHEVPWPMDIDKDVLEAFIKDKMGWHMTVQIREYDVVGYFPKWMYLFPRIVKRFSHQMWQRLETVIRHMNLGERLKALDSGIGNLVTPINAGKGPAIALIAKHFDFPVKDILCVGDRPEEGGNDEDFLSGQYGTPFSVGALPRKTYPLPVLNEKQVHVSGPEGTELLLKQIFMIS